MTAPRLPFVLVLGLALTLGLTTFLRVSIALRPSPPALIWDTSSLRSVVDWGTCRFGPSSCRVVTHPVADGGYDFISCNYNPVVGSAYCTPARIHFYSEPNCNRLTGCPRT